MEGPELESTNIPGKAADNRFPKHFRLSGRTAADRLFSLGQSFGHYPFRFVYLVTPLLDPEAAAQMAFLISVPKRQVKLAAGRNRLKRQIREAVRQHFRPILLPHLPIGTCWCIAILFTGGKNKFSFPELEKKLISGLKRLAEKATVPFEPKQG